MMALWIVPAGASNLKDIRIGEYEGFTRIVFELDSPVSSQNINPQESGQLVVTLNQTVPRLVRKIPVERSRHVRSIQFWQRRDHLSTSFQLDYDHFRFEYFPLTDPPRLALDVYPLVVQPKPAVAVETRQDESQIKTLRESTLLPSVDGGREIFDQTDPSTADSARDSAAVAQIKDKTPPDTEKGSAPAERPASLDIQSSTQTSRPTPQVRYVENVDPGPAKKAQTNGLQFYLVIILVAITIGILALLLIMLLSKRRWTDEKKEMNVNEFLKNQDKRIASLNARINEQLKRYEEA